ASPVRPPAAPSLTALRSRPQEAERREELADLRRVRLAQGSRHEQGVHALLDQVEANGQDVTLLRVLQHRLLAGVAGERDLLLLEGLDDTQLFHQPLLPPLQGALDLRAAGDDAG